MQQGRVDRAHVQAFHQRRFEPGTDGEFGRAASYVDDQATFLVRRYAVRDAIEDQACLLAAGDDFDGKAQQGLRACDEFAGIARHAQGIGGDGADPGGREAGNALGEARQGFQAAQLCGLVEALVRPQSRRQSHVAPQGILHVDLGSLDATDLEPETVGAEVQSGDLRAFVHAKCGSGGDREPV